MPQALAMIAAFGCVSRLYRGSNESEREVELHITLGDCNPIESSGVSRARKRIGRANGEVRLLGEEEKRALPFCSFLVPSPPYQHVIQLNPPTESPFEGHLVLEEY